MKNKIIVLLFFINFFNSKFDIVAQTNTKVIYSPDVLEAVYDSQFVQIFNSDNNLVSSGFTKNSFYTFDIFTSIENENHSISSDMVRIYPYTNGAKLQIPIFGNSDVNINLFNILGQKIFDDKLQLSSENNNYKLNTLNLSSGVYIINIQTKDYSSFSKLNIINGLMQGYFTNSSIRNNNKTKPLMKTTEENYRIVISDPLHRHYTRTLISNLLESDTIKVYVVPFPEQEGVTPELFRQYVWYVNVGVIQLNGICGIGLKSFFYNKDNMNGDRKYEIFIASKYERENNVYSFTTDQQIAIKNLIVKRFFDTNIIEEKYRPTIIIQDQNGNPPSPYNTDAMKGVILIHPYYWYYFGDFSNSGSCDGIIESSYVMLAQDFDSTQSGDVGPALEEISSSFLIGEYNFHVHDTVFNGGHGQIYPVDIIMFKIGQKLPPMSNLEDILGL